MISIKHNGDIFYQTPGSVGADLCAQESVVIEPGKVAMVGTGVFIESSDLAVGYWVEGKDMYHNPRSKWVNVYLQVVPHSSLYKRGLMQPNGVGIIDSDYRDEIKLLLMNFTDTPVEVQAGDRLAQLIGSLAFDIDGVDRKQVERTGGIGSTDGGDK